MKIAGVNCEGSYSKDEQDLPTRLRELEREKEELVKALKKIRDGWTDFKNDMRAYDMAKIAQQALKRAKEE